MSALKSHYCSEAFCLRKVFEPHIYCDKHEDKNSTPPQPDQSDKQVDKILGNFSEKFYRAIVKGGSGTEASDAHQETKAALTQLITDKEHEAKIKALIQLKSSPLGMVQEAINIIDDVIESLRKDK